MAESNSIDMNATTGDERDASDIVIPSSFTNFARNDDPFFCSWARDSNANKTETVEKEEDASLEENELTDRVHGIIGCKEKDNAPETVSNKNVTAGSNKEKEDGSLMKTESIAVPISDENFDCKMEKVNAPVNAKECGPSSASATARNLDMAGNVLIKVNELRPNFNDVNLLVKVVNVRKASRKGQGSRRVNLCKVGDETATIELRVTDNQVDIVKKGSTLTLYKAKINVIERSMELMVPAHGNIQVQQESATFTVKEDNNMSMIQWNEFRVRA